jgi:hypothetical protein
LDYPSIAAGEPRPHDCLTVLLFIDAETDIEIFPRYFDGRPFSLRLATISKQMWETQKKTIAKITRNGWFFNHPQLVGLWHLHPLDEIPGISGPVTGPATE